MVTSYLLLFIFNIIYVPEHGPPLPVLPGHNWDGGPCFAGSAKPGNPHPGN